jgi:hypothetical protein
MWCTGCGPRVFESLFVILGPSGAGKSSFLRAGLLPRLRGDDRRFLPLPTCGRSGHRRYNPAEQRPIRLMPAWIAKSANYTDETGQSNNMRVANYVGTIK